MLARRAAASLARLAAGPSSSRCFSAGLVSKKDFVQDLYLRELKAYKPKEVSANAHVGHVKEFHTPSAPKAPVVPTGADLAKELEAYESEEVGAAPGGSASSSSAEDSDASSSNTQTADEYISFVEQEARRQPSPDGHH